jgi:hypothetical protein
MDAYLAEPILPSFLNLLMQLVQSLIGVFIPLTITETFWRFGLKVRRVVWARFLHLLPATPLWWVLWRP